MDEHEKGNGFMDIITDGLGYISQIISASIFPPMAEGADMVMRTVEERLMRMQKRILRRMSTLMIICFGGVLLILSFLFFLIEYLAFSKAAAFFSIGIIIFVIGLLLKAGGYDR